MPAAPWQGGSGVRQRQYRSYETYLEHQASKLSMRPSTAEAFDSALREALSGRLALEDWTGMRVLCLAARLGGEVAAFRDQGAFAVGVDLNPGADNPFVLWGDFHDLQFPDGSVDAVFTNSLDHAFDVGRLSREVRRVLRPGGTFLVDAADFSASGPGLWEATTWDTPDDLAELIEAEGFSRRSVDRITSPWPGTTTRFEAVTSVESK